MVVRNLDDAGQQRDSRKGRYIHGIISIGIQSVGHPAAGGLAVLFAACTNHNIKVTFRSIQIIHLQ